MKLIFTLFSLLSFAAYGEINVKEAYSLSQEGKAVIIDVREKDELPAGMINGAQWFPLSKVKEDKNWKNEFQKLTAGKKIFLHCRTGNRSGQVQEILKKNDIASENIGGYEELKKVLPTKR